MLRRVVSKRNAQGDLEVWVARIPHSQRIVWAAVIRRHKRGSKEGWQPVFVSAQVGETVSEGLGNLDDYNKNLPKRDAPAVRDLRIGLRSSAAYAYTVRKGRTLDHVRSEAPTNPPTAPTEH